MNRATYRAIVMFPAVTDAYVPWNKVCLKLRKNFSALKGKKDMDIFFMFFPGLKPYQNKKTLKGCYTRRNTMAQIASMLQNNQRIPSAFYRINMKSDSAYAWSRV